MLNNLCRAKIKKSNQWVEGQLIHEDLIYPKNNDCKLTNKNRSEHSYFEGYVTHIASDTCCRFTGLFDRNNQPIFEGDITKLVLSDGTLRYFEVAIRTVERKIISHPDFDEPTSLVSISGVVFLWNKYELFPCIDETGISDISKMEIVGNIYDNLELLDFVYSFE